MKLPRLATALLVAALTAVGARSASAASITTVTVSGNGTNTGGSDNTGNGNQPINAQAVFTFTAGHLQLDLTNLKDDPVSVGSVLVGIAFSITGPGSASSPSNITRSGSLINIDGTTGAPSAYGGNVTTELAQWQLVNSPAPDFFKLGNGNDPGIIGYGNGGTAGSSYTAANPSITGSSHQPFVQRTLTLNMDIANLTVASDVTAVQFLFNTNFTSFNSTGTQRTPDGGNGNGQPTPLPASLWAGMALLGTLAVARSAKRRIA